MQNADYLLLASVARAILESKSIDKLFPLIRDNIDHSTRHNVAVTLVLISDQRM